MNKTEMLVITSKMVQMPSIISKQLLSSLDQIAKKEVQWIEAVRHSSKDPKDKEKHAASWQSRTAAHRPRQIIMALPHQGRRHKW